MKQSLQEILEGSVEEKIEAAEAIWNSIDESLIPITDEETRIVKDRYEQYLQNPNEAIDWKTAKQKLMAKYGL